MCVDHPEVQALLGTIRDRRIITYGTSPQADARLVSHRFEAGESRFGILLSDRRTGSERLIDGLSLPMPGGHNALNATAAIAVARELGVSDQAIRTALSGFGGVKRRFTRTGAHAGVTIYDDYGHHPVEIAAVLGAAREVTEGRVVAVAQPHRYTRLHSLFTEFCTCFNNADTVIVAPVYPAGEAPIDGATHAALAAGLKSRGHRSVLKIDDPAELPEIIARSTRSGDIVICLGAGTITQWAYALPSQLALLDRSARSVAGKGAA
jgi:UDP-N-acetylmuramate--alanine ligase